MEPTELDGLRWLVHDHDRAAFGITFRVGWADEELVERGLTHLVEHLALHEASMARLRVDGHVRATETSFVVDGTAEEAARFLWSLTSSLRALPVHRLGTEAAVLRTERAGRGGSAHGELLANRFGATAYGLSDHPELALEHPDPARLQAWADRWFTAENAVLWSTYRLPTDLRHDLGHGVPVAPPTLPAPIGLLPMWYSSPTQLVAASFLVPRTPATWMALPMLEDRLHRRLRVERGHSYQVRSTRDVWRADTLHGYVAADCLPDRAEDVRDGVLAELDAMAGSGPDAADVESFLRDLERSLRAPDAAMARLGGAVSDLLVGRRSPSSAAILADARAVTIADLRDAFGAMLATAVLQVPSPTRVDDVRFRAVALGSERSVEGREIRRGPRLDDESSDDVLVVGPTGVSFDGSTGLTLTVESASCAAVQRWRDGARTLWGRDGIRLFVHPDEWAGGDAAVAALDASFPSAIAVDMGSHAGSAYLDEVRRRSLPG